MMVGIYDEKKHLGEYQVLFLLLPSKFSQIVQLVQHLLQFVFTAMNSNKSIFLQYQCKQLNTLCQNFVYSNLKEKSKTRVSIESLGYNQNAYCRTFLSNFTSEIKSSFLR